ncbi:rhamnogalacturonate lyase, partial [Aureobasidium melanogenum]
MTVVWKMQNYLLSSLLLLVTPIQAFLNATENAKALIVANDRLYASVNKSTGIMDVLSLDGQNLLGTKEYNEVTPGGNAAGQNGIGPYLDCYCVPAGSYTPGEYATFKLFSGNDSTGVPYGGIVMSEVYPLTGQILEQYWFLRETETGLHTFSRLAYHNETKPFLRNLQEFRTLFRPTTPLWTHLSTNEKINAPLPSSDTLKYSRTVQDATWYIGNYTQAPYVEQFADYFTKYTFSDEWRDHKVHGIFGDGSNSKDGSTFGAWLVMNTVDTYFGGPTHSDLTVDGIVYNYISSNHHGDNVPNITTGFDRTFGPQYFHFNKGSNTTTLAELRAEAEKLASPIWNTAFYDSIAHLVPNYVPSTQRSTWRGRIDLPKGANRPIAVLAQNGVDFQDNVLDTKAYQYWSDIDEKGNVEILMVKPGTYRLTVYADGIFGQYIQDNIVVAVGKVTSTKAKWREESAGKELWRIGTPDRSSGEYRHGDQPDPSKPLHPPECRIYWANWDFPTDYPNGVTFEVGKSDESKDFNYVHWSVFGGYANSVRPEPYYDNVNNWTVLFDVKKSDIKKAKDATLTIQLAGAKTAAGNTDNWNATQPWNNLPLTVVMNDNELEPWDIPWNQSSSCATRSAVICYALAHKYEFDANLLREGQNKMILSLPFNATDYESAVLPRSTYVQYVLAEATKTLSLEKNTVDDDKDNLWVGATAFERRATPCEYAAGLLVAPDLLVSEDQGDVIVFPDLSEHVLFRDHILVTEVPHGRFYAGVPIISPSGYNIGVFCVLDDKPRADGLSTTEIGFMKDMAVTIMNHLAMVRATAELNRSQNMVQGLGQFVDGKSSIKDWWKGLNQAESDRPRSRTGTERNGRSGTRSLRFSNRHLRPSPTRKHSLEESPAPGNALGPQDGAPDAPTISPSTTPLQETQQPSEEASVANRLQEDSISPDIKSTFQRAADIIRESVDVDGAIFLDASIGSFAGLVDGSQSQQDSMTQSSADISSYSTRTSESTHTNDEKHCIVLGTSLATAAKRRSSHMAPVMPLSVSERFLQKLLSKYPRGKIWSYDDEDDSESFVDSPNTAHFVNRRGERWRERRLLRTLFPGARCLALVGMWDPHRSRWFAASILWTCNPTRILSTDSELNYMTAFGQSVMSEIARIDVKMADRAKATFISSISHELRTPLHGIMGSSECLQGTPLDTFQSSLINTIETCGKTLLDTFDNLLSYAKINNLSNSNYRRPSVSSTRTETHRNGGDTSQSSVDLSILVEEVVDTAFAGHEFVRVTPLKTGMTTHGVVPAHLTTAHPAKGLEAITVLLEYDTTSNWVFTTQAGSWIRIVLSLVGNSLKYTQRGRVTVRLESRSLPSPSSEEDVEVVLTVTDTGKGMSEDFLSQSVFSPFVQEDPLSPGTGLGLSIVKQIVTGMGGQISVESKQGEGTKFSVAVCMMRADSPTESDKSSAIGDVAAKLRGKRLNLIVPEDEHDEIQFADLCSKWFGVPVRCTSESEEADIYIVLKKHTNALVKQLAFKPASANPIGAKPVIVLCKDLASANALQSSKSMAAISSHMEYMAQPLAPNKIAKTLVQCLERPKCSTPDSSATPALPLSRATSISSQRTRDHRAGSTISQNSTNSNPEVVLYTPMEEKTQEMLMAKVRQSVEANRQVDALEAQKQALMPSVTLPVPSVSVLLVDDNNINLNLLATFMKKQRHAYDTATNGLEALQAYQAHVDPTRLPEGSENSHLLQKQPQLIAQSFDFVLMDVNMPEMDGLESTRRIRAFERAKGLRPAVIIALTGMASASVQQEAFASGVDLFLTKPVRLKELTKIFEGHGK